jgi:hypothetical protein
LPLGSVGFSLVHSIIGFRPVFLSISAGRIFFYRVA